MKFADLHVHTFYSDSTFSPEEVVSCAKDKALSAIAICDHDCIDGIAPCREIAKRYDIEVIPGLELTAEREDAEVHMLGYFMDTEAGWFTKKLQEIRIARVERMHEMVRKLKKAGLKIEASDVFGLAGKGSIGRLHMAKAMLITGNVRSLSEAFDKYIGFSKPCYMPSMKLSPEDAIKMILKAGGVPVLAHPNIMGHDEYIEEFVRHGLRGIEAYHMEHKESAVKRYERIAKDYGLLVTGGSDCHGLGKSRILMGEVRVPYELVEKLKAEAEKIKAAI